MPIFLKGKKMSKQIKSAELAEIVKRLLTEPEVGELDTLASYQGFTTEIAQVVCDYCGGEIRNTASFMDDTCYIGIHGNDSLPETGGIWAAYDPEGELFDDDQD